MLNKKQPNITGVDALIFYGQRLKLIRSDLYGIGLLWRSCENPVSLEMTGKGDECLVSCNKAGRINPCPSCISNMEVAKEKRRLKSQFNATVSKMLQFVPSEPSLCHKESPTFVDMELKKIEGLE